jgi:hypothetical protein
MQNRSLLWVCGLCVSAALLGFSQEGHPLTGTWGGDCGVTATARRHLTVVIDWDGNNLTGTINPGPDAIPIKSIYLDVATWTVRIQADSKDANGNPVHIMAEGRIQDLGSPHRKIVGTWREDAKQGDFTIERN